MGTSKPTSLSEWQDFFNCIYGTRNANRGSLEIWAHLVGRAGLLAKALRKEERKEIAENLTHIFAWLCGVCNRYQISLSEIVWEKYPGFCLYCGRIEDCNCIGRRKEPLEYSAHPAEIPPAAIADWQKMFNAIYGSVNRVSASFQIGLHLLEEIGEVSRAIVYQKGYSDEFADVFAWIIALANKLGLKLDEVLWKFYQNGCPFCKKPQCECA